MGCFSFLCTECGGAINSDSFSGEHARLALLVDGKVIEEMLGQYDSYGRVFNGEGHEGIPGSKIPILPDSFEWKKEWGEVCDLIYDDNPRSGISAAHVDCITAGNVPTKVSKNDPNQGWGEYNPRHTQGICESYHKFNF